MQVFSVIAKINESKLLIKHISCECKWKFDDINCNSNQKKEQWQMLMRATKFKEKLCLWKRFIWNPSAYTCENGKYLEIIIGDSVIVCIVEVTKADTTNTIPIIFNEEKLSCKIENFYILLTFVLIAMSLLIIVNIYCYFMKHRSKQKYLLPYHDTSKKLKEIDINNII